MAEDIEWDLCETKLKIWQQKAVYIEELVSVTKEVKASRRL
jgi:hypothetical protein